MTDREEWLERFRRLRQWSQKGQRAPHKPLLVLLALGDVQCGRDRQHSFTDIDERLGSLLRRFGPPRRPAPEYPFYHLTGDQVWETPGIDAYKSRAGHAMPTRTALLAGTVTGAFPEDLHQLLESDLSLITQVAEELLEKNFPESMHMEILDAVGLGGLRVRRRSRDASFRPNVLLAYENRCAVCNLDSSLDGLPYLLDAAHIRWHNMEGPDEVSNGLALCALHHRAFDRGAIGVDPNYQVVVSAMAIGGTRHEESLLRFHGRSIRPPYDPAFLPRVEFLQWHSAQVFREPARPLRGPV